MYLLCCRIVSSIDFPMTPSTSLILFILFFYELLLSMFFLKIDHIDISKSFSQEKISEFIFSILLEFVSVFLILKSLRNLSLLSFVSISYISPILSSHLSLRQKMQIPTKIDRIFYFIAFLIVLIEFTYEDKISTIYSCAFVIIYSFSSAYKMKAARSFHPYVILLGCSFLGVAVSPLLMSFFTLQLNLSLIQYLFIFLLGFSHFFFLYFRHKRRKIKSFNERRSLFNYLLPLSLVYSILILKDKLYFSTYIIAILSILVYLRGNMKLEGLENEGDEI